MVLSVIIVNYNVRHFLEQCLYSVQKALEKTIGEIIITDNNSVDGSVDMIRKKFPHCKLIENKENVGFSKANNQAILQASGKYVLLLNPDTIVQEDTFEKCIHFFESHPEAGALGVKMIDGRGRFLPESKRALPTPLVAFFKIFGFSGIFPNSPFFNRYHLGYLPVDQTNEVDILPGAFMLIRKEVLDLVGLLDEEYFMYGEDIDLSYRIIQAGYKNYYFPETSIIHYKGESTKKGSLNYVGMFYKAMLIFAKKYFAPGKFRLYSLIISTAIYFRASISVLKRILLKSLLPVLDILLIFTGYYFLVPLWEQFKFYDGFHYPAGLYYFAVPLYIFIWSIFNFFSGGWDRPVKIHNSLKGIVSGTLFILIIYALLPLQFRYSRALILLGSLWSMLSLTGIRIILHLLSPHYFQLSNPGNRRLLIAGGPKESLRIRELLEKSVLAPEIIGCVSEPGAEKRQDPFLGTFSQLYEIIRIHHFNEVIFCAEDISAEQIISAMTRLSEMNILFKIAPPQGLGIIGSNMSENAGVPFLFEVNAISKQSNRRNKRLLDIALAFVLLVLYLPLSLFVRKPAGLLKNIFSVLTGSKTWVGYDVLPGEIKDHLPPLKQGILHPSDLQKGQIAGLSQLKSVNLVYAKDYKPAQDLKIVFSGYKNLGRQKAKKLEF